MPSDLKHAIRDALIVVIAFLVAGAAAGWLWHAIWAPAPEATGALVTSGKPAFPPESYIRATGLYALIAAGVGGVLGAGLAFLLDRDEVVTLFAVVAGALAAGHLMAEVGHRLGPDDPPAKVTSPEQLAEVVAALDVELAVVWTVMPTAAVAGAALAFLTFARRRPNTESSG